MMRWIVASSLKFRRLIVAVAAGSLVLGVAQLRNTSVDTLPEFTPPMVEVQTEALGLSAAEVEQLITVPLEQDLLNGVAFLERIESTSLPGLSSVVLTFEPGTNILHARQVVQERLTQAHALPQVSQPPQMLQPLSSTSRVAMVRLTSEQLSLIEMSVLTRWDIRPRLMGVDGVANVSVWGLRDRQLQVLVDPQQMHDRGISLQQVVRTTANALWWCPLTFVECSTPGVGGFFDTAQQRFAIHHENPIKQAEDLAEVTVEDGDGGTALGTGGETLLLGDVAHVVENHPPLIGDAVCREGGCLLLVIEKLPGANTLEVTRGVDAAIEAMRPGLADMRFDSSIYRPATYIERSFANLTSMLLIGAGLMLLVVAAFVWNWRRLLIFALAVAVSLVTATLVLYLSGTTVNLLMLVGLVVALGVIVDDAVVEVDAAVRRLREHRLQGGGTPVWSAVLEATLEMRSPMLFATLIVVAALVPAFFVGGEAGAFLPSMAMPFILAVAASMVVALTVTPALSLMLLGAAEVRSSESPLARWLNHRYEELSSRVVPRPTVALATVLVTLLVGLVAFPFIRQSMRPQLQEGDVLIHWEAAPGASLPSMNEVTARAVADLESIEGVNGVGAHVGRAVMSDQVVNVSSGEIWVNLDPAVDHGSALASIEGVVDRYPEISSEVLTYSEERITDVLGTSSHDVVIRIYGDDGEILRAKASEVLDIVAGVDGIEKAEVAPEPMEPTIEIEVDLERARAVGLKPGDVRRAAAALLSGIGVGALFEEQKVFDVVVWGAPEIRSSESDVRELLIDTPDGGLVRLEQVADVRIVPNLAAIRHESVSKFVDVSANVAGRDVGTVAADVERALETVTFDLDYHAELLGGFAAEQVERARAVAVAAASALAIFLLLQAAFGSWRLAILTFFALPTALAGGAAVGLIADGTVTLGSVAGFAGILALAVRQVVALIWRYQQLLRDGEPFGVELVVRGTRDRLAPMLTTMLATAVLFLPIAVAGRGAGFEIVGPMSVVILGGLVTTTLLSLLIVPALYLRYGFVSVPDATEDELVVRVPDVDTVQG